MWISTRWIFLYLVGERLLELKEFVQEVAKAPQFEWEMPINWKKLKALVDLLKPFYIATQTAQGVKTNTISHIIPCLLELQQVLQKFPNELKPVDNEKLKSVLTRFDRILCFNATENPNFDPTFIVAAFLDPIICLLLMFKIPDLIEFGKIRLKLLVLTELRSNESPQKTIDLPTSQSQNDLFAKYPLKNDY